MHVFHFCVDIQDFLCLQAYQLMLLQTHLPSDLRRTCGDALIIKAHKSWVDQTYLRARKPPSELHVHVSQLLTGLGIPIYSEHIILNGLFAADIWLEGVQLE